jgi:NIMA (never in mitosis gene a)-related kinase
VTASPHPLDGTAKLGDLNVSKLTKGDDLMQTKIGTPYYMAPEVWAGKKYDEACDVWSLGAVVYELAALEPPFQGTSLMQLRRAVSAGRYPPLPSSYSPQLSRIIGQMLVVEPSRRLKALDILEHDEVRKRRATHELAHPAPLPEDADDVELLATISKTS